MMRVFFLFKHFSEKQHTKTRIRTHSWDDVRGEKKNKGKTDEMK